MTAAREGGRRAAAARARRSCRSPTAPAAPTRDADRRRSSCASTQEQPFPAMPHLTCVGHTRAELADLLDQLPGAGHREHPGPGRRPAGRRLRRRRRLRATPPSWSSWPARWATSPSAWPPSPSSTPARRTGPPTAGYLAAKLEPGRLRHHPVLLRRRPLPAHGRRAGRPRLHHAGPARRHAVRQRRRHPPHGRP